MEAFLTHNYELNTHISSVHEKKNNFKCTICDSSFSSKPEIQKHIEAVRT